MSAAKRRETIQSLLRKAGAPLSAATLAAHCAVSRQIIVGDIALLRAGGLSVLATPRGYVLESAPQTHAECSVACRHGNERMMEELYTVVDLGGSVLDVTVEHAVYGQLCGQLHIRSRFDVDAFCNALAASGGKPLSNLTEGIHLHRIRADNQDALERIINALDKSGYLYHELSGRE